MSPKNYMVFIVYIETQQLIFFPPGEDGYRN